MVIIAFSSKSSAPLLIVKNGNSDPGAPKRPNKQIRIVIHIKPSRPKNSRQWVPMPVKVRLKRRAAQLRKTHWGTVRPPHRLNLCATRRYQHQRWVPRVPRVPDKDGAIASQPLNKDKRTTRNVDAPKETERAASESRTNGRRREGVPAFLSEVT